MSALSPIGTRNEAPLRSSAGASAERSGTRRSYFGAKQLPLRELAVASARAGHPAGAGRSSHVDLPAVVPEERARVARHLPAVARDGIDVERRVVVAVQ